VNDSTWTWISGSDKVNEPGVYGTRRESSSRNVPGARNGAVGWYDSEKQQYWLFGGHGYATNSTVGA